MMSSGHRYVFIGGYIAPQGQRSHAQRSVVLNEQLDSEIRHAYDTLSIPTYQLRKWRNLVPRWQSSNFVRFTFTWTHHPGTCGQYSRGLRHDQKWFKIGQSILRPLRLAKQNRATLKAAAPCYGHYHQLGDRQRALTGRRVFVIENSRIRQKTNQGLARVGMQIIFRSFVLLLLSLDDLPVKRHGTFPQQKPPHS